MKVPLSNFTLGMVMANVRSQTSTINENDSGLYKDELVDIVHTALLLVWSKEKIVLRQYYTVTESVAVDTLQNGTSIISLASIDVSDFNTITLSDDNGLIGLVSRAVYNNIISSYTVTERSAVTLGILDSMPASESGGLYGIEMVVGVLATPIANPRLSYTRVPQKAITSSTMLDIPDQYVPVVEATACRLVQEKLRGLPPQPDIKINEDLNAQIGGRK